MKPAGEKKHSRNHYYLLPCECEQTWRGGSAVSPFKAKLSWVWSRPGSTGVFFGAYFFFHVCVAFNQVFQFPAVQRRIRWIGLERNFPIACKAPNISRLNKSLTYFGWKIISFCKDALSAFQWGLFQTSALAWFLFLAFLQTSGQVCSLGRLRDCKSCDKLEELSLGGGSHTKVPVWPCHMGLRSNTERQTHICPRMSCL